MSADRLDLQRAVASEAATGCAGRGLLGGFAAGARREWGAWAKTREQARALAITGTYEEATVTARRSELHHIVPLDPTPPPTPKLTLSSPVTDIDGVAARTATTLMGMGIETVRDLLYHLPREYLDRSAEAKLADVRIGSLVTVTATVKRCEVKKFGGKRQLTRVSVSDGSGWIDCQWWNQPWKAKQLPVGTTAAFSGVVESRAGRLQMSNPAFDILAEESNESPTNTARIVGVYPASEKLPSERIRAIVESALKGLGELSDPLPARVKASRNLVGLKDAVSMVHTPRNLEDPKRGRERLVYEELFTLQVALAMRKRHIEASVEGISQPETAVADAWVKTLGFAPTSAQERSFAELAADMAASGPMNRLLQGEVGSGKTLVAVYAALIAVGSGHQAAVMAPTEVLATQHARKIREMLEGSGVDVGLVTSSVPKAVRADTTMRLAHGDLGIVCGTHALLSSDVEFHRLGLVIVDEQHRFGLGQRMALRAKGTDPDVLIMTATPIPRTLALTLYGDLDVTVLDELPAGRQPIETRVIESADPSQRQWVYDLIRSEIDAGRRAYVVCALVEASDTLSAAAATEEAERLATVFPDLEVGLLHGQMRPADKDRVMEKFRFGEIQLLISTTVIEVGVDVPEATVMMIENAERFGLSQLHQLRGRVGRGGNASHCILVAGDSISEEGYERLRAVEANADGFVLAEEDLRMRGEGTIFSTRQSGAVDLKIASLVEDFPTVVQARTDAFELVAADPRLRSPVHKRLLGVVSEEYSDAVEWLFHG